MQLGNIMLYNNISKVIQMIPLFTREGTQNILSVEHAHHVVSMINKKDLADPNTTYQDPQCGTGLIMLVLAETLMDTLATAIPNEQDRLNHIFTNQLFLSDIDSTQYRVARANILRAVGDRTFTVNVAQADCFANTRRTNYTISSIDFETTNEFVPQYLQQSSNVIVVTRANKHSYEGRNITDINTYRFLGLAQSLVPICIMYFKSGKKTTTVDFTDGERTVTINNPTFLPGRDLDGYLYANEVLKLGFKGYTANYGTISRGVTVNNQGRVPVIFGAGEKNSRFGEIIKVSKKIVSDRDGLGKHKLVVSKNGNRGRRSVIKYAGPEYAIGYTALWIEVADQKEFDKINEIWEAEACYDKLIRILKETSPANGTEFWKLVPKMENLKQVKAIYERYYKSNNN